MTLRTVLLRHSLPDGSSHFDWMFEPAPDAALVTFRVPTRIDRGVGSFDAERIGEHRRDYLEYEGPVSGGRGAVERAAAGVVVIHEHRPERLEMDADWGDGPVQLIGEAVEPPRWRFLTLG